MRGLDAYVLPSLGEGISNTILEAMATGLPVVATDVGGSPELVQPGLTGELVPSGDVEAMARAILRLCADRAVARAMGLAARRQAQQRFSLDAMVRAYGDLYRSELASRTGGGR